MSNISLYINPNGGSGAGQGLIIIESKIGDFTVVSPVGATTVTGLTNGSDTLTSPEFAGYQVEVFFGNIPIPGQDMGDGGIFFTKSLSSDTITLSQALATDDQIKIKIFSPVEIVDGGDTDAVLSVNTVLPDGDGDVTLTKSDIGLGNVDNTSDTNKPISTATQTALDAKQATLVSGTNIKTINSVSLLGSGDIALTSFNLASGTYSPTITSVANLDSVSISTCVYQRNGSVVNVSGEITIDPTAGGGTLTRARFTLPVASNFGNSWNCNGVATISAAATIPATGGITADTTNDQAELSFPANFTSSVTLKFTMQYIII